MNVEFDFRIHVGDIVVTVLPSETITIFAKRSAPSI